jgi:lysophospholipase L1-like esterase
MVRRLSSILVTAAVAVAVLATPASAAPPSYYLALGDSLAYGYQPVRPLDRTEGYVYQLQATTGLALQNLGCPGETTTTMLDGGICPYPDGRSQLATADAFLRAHRGHVALVTIDIGANDLNHCVHSGVIDQACVPAALHTVVVNLLRIVVRLRAAAPFTRMIGMTYYDPYLAAYLTGPAGQELARQSLAISDEFNGLLTVVYRLLGFRVADVAAAFSTDDMTLTGGVPLDVLRICQWTWMCAPPPLGPDIHANKAGYAVIAQTFSAYL